MKKGIHPQYYEKAEITCTCGAKFIVGSTVPKMQVEICSNCHPFYTGQKKLVDTTGRVQRFQERLAKTKKIKAKLESKKKQKNTSNTKKSKKSKKEKKQ